MLLWKIRPGAYLLAMDHLPIDPRSADAEQDDLSLLRWMLTLTPQQRLAELESRLAFIHEIRGHVAQLSDHTEHTATPRR